MIYDFASFLFLCVRGDLYWNSYKSGLSPLSDCHYTLNESLINFLKDNMLLMYLLWNFIHFKTNPRPVSAYLSSKWRIIRGPPTNPPKNSVRTGRPEQTFSMLKPDVQGFRKCIDQNYCNLWWVDPYFYTDSLDYWAFLECWNLQTYNPNFHEVLSRSHPAQTSDGHTQT